MVMIPMPMAGVMLVIIGQIAPMIQLIQTPTIYVVFVMVEQLSLELVIWIVMENVM